MTTEGFETRIKALETEVDKLRREQWPSRRDDTARALEITEEAQKKYDACFCPDKTCVWFQFNVEASRGPLLAIIKAMRNENKELRAEIREVQEENKGLRLEIPKLQEENSKLRKENKGPSREDLFERSEI